MNTTRPIAIVLSKTATGFGTIRALARSNVEVHAIIFDPADPVRFSRLCRKIALFNKGKDEAALLAFLLQYCSSFDSPPVIFPSSDAHVLFLAKNYEALSNVCRTWTTTYPALLGIVSKDGLQQNIAAAGLESIPTIIGPSLTEVARWVQFNKEPYLVKPFYASIPNSPLREKNLIVPTEEQLLDFVSQQESDSFIVQRIVQGGDGYIFDCYGYCDRNGRVITMASHRRWRQYRPDYGATSFGEIPAGIDPDMEASIFSNTRQLLAGLNYHGIFGIEWLWDRNTEKLYAIDFNARPFLTIGHLNDCGLNLPELAYRELIGEELGDVELTPPLKQLLWVDLLRDIESFREKENNDGHLGVFKWLSSIARCRSFAYFDVLDPGPGISRFITILERFSSFMAKQATSMANASVPSVSSPSHEKQLPAHASKRIYEIDLLRFVAAIAVVFFDYSFGGYLNGGLNEMSSVFLATVSKYGYLGTEMFFLISGFVILMTASSSSLRQFIISRTTRLYPAFWMCCTVIFLSVATIDHNVNFTTFLTKYFFSMTMLHEVIAVLPMDSPYWGLSVEIKFYALTALFLMTGFIRRIELLLHLWIAGIAALWIFPSEILRTLLIYDSAPYFIAGAMCYVIYAKGLNRSRLAVVGLAWLLALFGAIQSIDGLEHHFHMHLNGYVVAAVVTLSFASLFLVSLGYTTFLAKKEWLTLGALTYPLYLVHQKLGYLIFNLDSKLVDPNFLLWGTVALMICIAYLVNVKIERPYSRKLKQFLEGFFPFSGKKNLKTPIAS